MVGVASWKDTRCPSTRPYVYGRVSARKEWILENTSGTQDSKCSITTTATTTEDPMLAKTQSQSDEDLIPVELIVGVSAAALVLVVSIIVGVGCWKKGKCGRGDTN